MQRAPRVGIAQVFRQPAKRIIDSRVERHLRRPALELVSRQQLEKLDRVVVQSPPQQWIELPEQPDHVRLPGPPQIPGQLPQLVRQLCLTNHGLAPSASTRGAVPSTRSKTPLAGTFVPPQSGRHKGSIVSPNCPVPPRP